MIRRQSSRAQSHRGRAAELIAKVPVLHSNQLELLVDGEETFADIFAGIDTAEDTSSSSSTSSGTTSSGAG